jgi:hypothetical protein
MDESVPAVSGRWVDTGGWGVSGTVDFSIEARCYVWTCIWGCAGSDCEGEQEARDQLLTHSCRMDS